MRKRINLFLSVITGVICSAVSFDSDAASSIRQFGSGSVYTSASNAATSKPSGPSSIDAVRSGSMRLMPGMGSSASIGSASTSTGGSISGSVPRLSIGSYLQGGTTQQGSSSVRPIIPGVDTGGGSDSTDLSGINTSISNLTKEINNLKSDKQNNLTAGNGIEIKNNIISLTDAVGGTIEMQTTATHVQWRNSSTGPWVNLIAIEDLKGEDGTGGGGGGISEAIINSGDSGGVVVGLTYSAATNQITLQKAFVTGSHIADGSIESVDLATNSVTEAKIADGSVTHTKLASNAVETDNIADLNVTNAKLANLSVTTDKLATGSITGGTGGVIADGTIQEVDLAQTIVEKLNKIGTGGDGTEYSISNFPDYLE